MHERVAVLELQCMMYIVCVVVSDDARAKVAHKIRHRIELLVHVHRQAIQHQSALVPVCVCVKMRACRDAHTSACTRLMSVQAGRRAGGQAHEHARERERVCLTCA